jgi:subtilase family serine protease
MFGLPANSPKIILNGPDPGLISDETEADIDVEWSGAVAKGATVDLVVSESTEATLGVDLSALYIIDNNLAPIMSESYGVCEAQSGAGGNVFHSTLWEQAAAQGITVLVASGDTGSAVCDRGDPNVGQFAALYGLAVNGFASTPFNVAVGGTDLNLTSTNIATYWTQTNTPNTNSSALSYIPETTWNLSCAASGSLTGCTPPPSTPYLDAGIYLIAGSGGSSNCINPTGTFPTVTCRGNYPKPPWQIGAGVPSDSARDVPDVSLLAAGYVICQMDANGDENSSLTTCNLNAPQPSFQVVGGTSASVQAFAGVMALVNQAHGRQGNANYVLYPMAAGSGASCNSSTAPVTNSSCVFYDITVGNNSVICQGGSPNCSNTNSASGQYGILVSGSSPAYVSTAGYDLATGLGSVNVANLVNNWTSNFTTSTITLALATNPATHPITLTHGQPIDFTVKVASGSGTPSGDVSLIAQAGSGSNHVTGIGPFTLSGGSVTGSSIMLPGGSYKVTAHYAGNGTLAPSDSSPGIPVVVKRESSKTDLELVTFDPTTGAPSYGATSTAYGSAYVLRMNVTDSSGQPCASATTGLISYPCPSGALIVSPAPSEVNAPTGTTPGHYTLNTQGLAEDQPIQQAVGNYSFVASYAGDDSFTSSVSPTEPITITKAPTKVTLTGMPTAPITPGLPAVNAVLVTQSNAVAPTGTMQLLSNGAPLGFPVTVFGTAATSSGYATAQASFYPLVSAGDYSFSVQYSGDGNYASSTSPATKVKVFDFSLSVNPTSVNISAPGGSAHTTLTLTPENGFAEATNLACYIPSDVGLTCTISPATLNVTGSSAKTATLTVNSTGTSSSKSPPYQPMPPPTLRQPAGWPWLLAGFLALAAWMSLARSRSRPPGWLFLTALLAVGAWVACGGGGGGGNPTGPPPAPIISLSTTSLDFGQIAMGSGSAPQTVTLTNSGNAALDLGVDAIGGANYSDFTLTQDACRNATVAPGGTCLTKLAFVPQATGQFTASITFSGNANTYGTVSMSGTGVQPPTPPGNYSFQITAVTVTDDLVHQTFLTVNVQ